MVSAVMSGADAWFGDRL